MPTTTASPEPSIDPTFLLICVPTTGNCDKAESKTRPCNAGSWAKTIEPMDVRAISKGKREKKP